MCYKNDENVIGNNEGPKLGVRWELTLDGTSNSLGNGVRAFIISSRGGYTPFKERLCFDCTNNMVEHKACIMGIEAAIDLKIKILEVYEDSSLVIYQVKGEWENHHLKLILYGAHVVELMKYFDEITFHHIQR